MIPCKLLLNDAQRQWLRDDCLWVREIQRLTFFNLRYMQCPCSKCQGTQRLLLRTVRKYLIRNGRDPTFRMWKGPGVQDSSDEEWEDDSRKWVFSLQLEIDSQVNT